MSKQQVYILEESQFLEVNHDYQAVRIGLYNGDTKDSFHPFAERVEIENVEKFLEIYTELVEHQEYGTFSEFPKAFQNDVAEFHQEIEDWKEGFLYASNELAPDDCDY